MRDMREKMIALKNKAISFVKENKTETIIGFLAALLLGGTIVVIAIGNANDNKTASATSETSVSKVATETSNLSASEIETDAAGKIIAVKVGETEYELKEYESEEKDGAIIYKLLIHI